MEGKKQDADGRKTHAGLEAKEEGDRSSRTNEGVSGGKLRRARCNTSFFRKPSEPHKFQARGRGCFARA